MSTPSHSPDRVAKQFLRVNEFAEATGLSSKTVQRRLKRRQLPAVQPGGPNTAWLIDFAAFTAATGPGGPVPEPTVCGPNQGTTVDASPDEALDAQRVRSHVSDAPARIAGPRPKWMRRN